MVKRIINMADEREKLAKAIAGSYTIYQSMNRTWAENPWISMVDKLAFDNHDNYEKVIKDCRFYFRHDPLASTVIRKLVDLSINNLVVQPDGKATVTEKAIYNALEKDLIGFLRKAAFEFLITGLLVPEIKLTRISKSDLQYKNIKRLESLMYPTSMWIRDSKDIEIKRPLITEKESLFLKISEEVLFFIQNKGEYPDGERDVELYKEIAKLYPEFVKQILAGKTKVLLENPLVIKSLALADSAYPIPYLYPALEALKHKRNLRRMDYSVAARVISAILHVKVGSDDFPLTEDQEDELTDLENKFKWRETLSTDDVERVFAFFTNHTVDLKWIFPEMEALLDDKKYDTVNQDIIVALGFPRILITGETERSFASDPQIATLSPLQTMQQLQRQLLPIAEKIFMEMKNYNKILTTYPIVKFKPINLMSLQLFYDGLSALYESGNLSRTDYTEAYGYDFRDTQEQRAEEDELMKELDVEEFAPVPHSNEPNKPGATTKTTAKPKGRPKKAPESKGKTPKAKK
jgi:hypothetical protein